MPVPRRCGWLIVVGLVLTAAGRADEIDRLRPIPLTAPQRVRCLDVLRAGLKFDEFWPAIHAAEALTLGGAGDEVLAALAPRLENETDEQRRCGLAREMVRAGDRSRLPILFQILENPKSNARIHAAESLFKLGEVGDGRGLRAALAERPEPALESMVAAALARCGNPSAMARIREHLRSSDPETRELAAWLLGFLGDARDVDALRTYLVTAETPLARAFSACSLACLGDSLGRKTLGTNLDAKDVSLRTFAAEFAAHSRSVEFRDKLFGLLDDPVLDVRVRSAQSLLAFALNPDALPLPLAFALKDVSVDVFPANATNPRYSEGSIVALRDGSLLYATTEFIGDGEDHATAHIVGRASRDGGRTWDKPRVVQANVGRQNVMSVTLRRLPSSLPMPPIGMFHLVKNGPNDLKAYLRISRDEAVSFGEPILITSEPGYHVMNNDRVTILRSGRLVCPIAWAEDVFKKGHFVCYCCVSDDAGQTWTTGRGRVDQPQRGAMEPEVVELDDGSLLMIVRTQLGKIATSLSTDGGDHWSEPSQFPLPAPEAPATIRRIPATGDLLLVWNNTFRKGVGHGGLRTPLTAAISSDQGKTWSREWNLETDPNRTFAYTSMLFHQDRLLLGYYVRDEKTGLISSRFRSLPVRAFYAEPMPSTNP